MLGIAQLVMLKTSPRIKNIPVNNCCIYLCSVPSSNIHSELALISSTTLWEEREQILIPKSKSLVIFNRSVTQSSLFSISIFFIDSSCKLGPL